MRRKAATATTGREQVKVMLSIVALSLFLLVADFSEMSNLPKKLVFTFYDVFNTTTTTAARIRKAILSEPEQPSTLSPQCPQFPCDLSIVFIGDSLSRFMYVSLVHFLRHNKWIEPTDNPNLVKPRDYIGGTEESTFNWKPYFIASTKALAPYEACDCWREPSDPNNNRKYETIVENRYFHDPIRNNTIVYLFAYGNKVPMRGHWNDSFQLLQNTSLHGPWTNETTIPPFVWTYDHWADAVLNQVVPIRPHTLVMNAGHWKHAIGRDSYRERVAEVSKQSVPQVIWRTTTADDDGSFDEHLHTDRAICVELECLNVTGWTSKLDKAFYVDKVHFIEPVYRKMNELLLWNHIYPNHPTMKYQYSDQKVDRLMWSELGLNDSIATELEQDSL
ncbi:hypothetical protein IV203_005528 [Nitzschia inconspicua]|uniref:Uncharacterized protein n=1 Tax=Nitzschia inconspicua TaxID=303405 RepID=A0A9K3KML6_9STRA|nr:hypothetical protein IV203_005528 [Nitzschia inconspicua]